MDFVYYTNGFLGLRPHSSVDEPTVVEELSNKAIIAIICGSDFSIGSTKNW